MKARQPYRWSADVAPPAKSALTAAFTLIELSIVLVIIGLIVGAIVLGADLIHAAKLRATVRQVEQFDTAINTFKEKYNCLPGDCTDAWAYGFQSFDAGTDIFPTGHAVATQTPYEGNSVNGNGDGKIYDLANGNTNNHEIEDAWWWLQQSGLVSGVVAEAGNPNAFIAIPSALDGGEQGHLAVWTVAYMDQTQGCNSVLAGGGPPNLFFLHPGHYYWLSAYGDSDGSPPAILPAEAYAIDEKIDDGLPRSGKVLASGNDSNDGDCFGAGGNADIWPVSDPTGAILGHADEGPAGATSNYCVTNATTPQYNVANTSRVDNTATGISSLCTLTVDTNF